MDYRTSKTVLDTDKVDTGAVRPVSSDLQLKTLDGVFSDIAKRLTRDMELMGYCPKYRKSSHPVFDLGPLHDEDVMLRMAKTKGYIALHETLKEINADFHFQILPSAGVLRPTPMMLLNIELNTSYGTNCTSRNRHMYPDHHLNDNHSAPEASGQNILPLNRPMRLADTPISFRFA